MKKVNFRLNDFQYTINKKLTLIQACLENKVDVPRFCFHERLSIAGNCRMCLVEDLKQVKPVASCAINVSDSMSIYTNTLKVKKARESVLEFLLANHPLDCPICDQGGECDLQDQSMVFGSDRGRFYEFKRSVEDKDCGPLIKTIMNRCIHCTRCVRFSTEIAGLNILGVTGRGSKMEIGFYIENLMRSELSGNVIDLCPVGALTSKPFAFTSRPWELKSYNTIDILDNMHSNIRVDIRGTKIMRILPRVNEFINEDWIGDRIRFSYDGLRRQRLVDPMLRIGGVFVKLSWKKSLLFLKNLFLNYLKKTSSRFLPITAYVGDHLDIETIYMIKRMLNMLGSGSCISHVNSADFGIYYSCNTSIQDISQSDIILLFGVNLRLQYPILNAKIRQVSLKNQVPVYLLGYYSNFSYYTKHISTTSNTFYRILEGSHWISSKISKVSSKSPLFYFSDNFLLNNSIIVRSLLSWSNVFNREWNGYNVLSSQSSYFSINELGLRGSNTFKNLNYSFSWLFNYDGDVSSVGYKVYQGHHGDKNISGSSLVLPSTSFIEKSSFYSNMWGMVQKTKKVLFSVGNSRDDWKIVNAFLEVSGFSFLYKNSFDLLSSVSKSSPFVLYKRNKIDIFFTSNCLQVIHFNNIFSFTNNYYLTDSITRNSKLMSLCSSRFKLKGYNFILQ